MTSAQLAKAAYGAYGDSTHWKNFRGEPMPKFEDLPEVIQNAWIAATKKVKAIVEGGDETQLDPQFERAKQCRMPFGKHKDKVIDDIAKDDEGLLYLDWLFGEMKEKNQNVGSYLFKCLDKYLSDETMQDEIQEAMKKAKEKPKTRR